MGTVAIHRFSLLWPAGWLATLGLLLLPQVVVAQAADKTCAALQVTDVSPLSQAQALEDQYAADPSDPLPLWKAATVLRCALPAMTAIAPVCLQAGDAKSLYDKFRDSVGGLGLGKTYKSQNADATKQGKALAGKYAVDCVATARETLKANQPGKAALLYESAYVLTYKPNLLYNAARACEIGKLWMQAAVYFTAYLSLEAPWRDRKDAVQKLVEIQQRLASDTGGQVRIAVDAANAATMLAERAERQAQAAQRLSQDAAQKADVAQNRAGQAEVRAQRGEQLALEAKQQSFRAEETAKTADSRAAQAQSKSLEYKTRLETVERQVYDILRREAERPPPSTWAPRSSWLPDQAQAPGPAQ
jgi:hypothetical protein